MRVGPIAVGVGSLAVRSTAAWLPCSMGPSRSRAATSRTPRRWCVRACFVCCTFVSHGANAHASSCTRCCVPHGYASWCRRHVARCGAPIDGAHGAAHGLCGTRARRVVRCVPPGWSMVEYSFMIIAEGANPIKTRSAPQLSTRDVDRTMRLRSHSVMVGAVLTRKV
jgi:hypothetical protein